VRKYELTGRGKLVIAMLIVFLIILPLVLIIIWAVTPHEADFDEPIYNINQNENGPASDDSLPEADLDFDDNDNGFSDDHSIADFDTVTVSFSPGSQTDFDEDAVLLIGEFLLSELNAGDNGIIVEIPQLSDGEALVLTTALIDVFDGFDVALSRVVFFLYNAEHDTGMYEIILKYE